MAHTGLELRNKTSQSLAVTPQMIQTLRVVQFATPELVEHIQHELSDNPFLEEAPSDTEVIDSEAAVAQDETDHQLEYNDDRAEDEGRNSSLKKDGPGAGDVIERTAAAEEGLADVLLEQLSMSFAHDSEDFQVGEYLIGCLDEDGYLPADALREAKEAFEKISAERFDLVLETIRNFDPPGIAQSDLRSALMKQLEIVEDAEGGLEWEILDKHFEDLRRKRFPDLARALGLPEVDVARAVHHISLLEPKPARRYRRIETPYIVPDVVVRRTDAGLQVSVNDEALPKITFNDEYRKFIRIKNHPELKEYLREKEERAQLLLASMRYRSRNLLTVTRRILEFQAAFFQDGPQALVPYTLVRLSEETGINAGTLSRIVSSKYIETDWGVFPLRVFFSSSVGHVSGDAVSSNRIKLAIQEILREMGDGKKRLSDQKIVEVLAKRGFKVARRTVAKYRQSIGILSSFHR